MHHRSFVIVQRRQPRAGVVAILGVVDGIEFDRFFKNANDIRRTAGGIVVRTEQLDGVAAHGAIGRFCGDDAFDQCTGFAIVLGIAEQRTHGGKRMSRIVEVFEPHRGDARAALIAIFFLQRRQPAFPQRDQVGESLVAFEQTLEANAELMVLGRERHQALQITDRRFGTIGDVFG